MGNQVNDTGMKHARDCPFARIIYPHHEVPQDFYESNTLLLAVREEACKESSWHNAAVHAFMLPNEHEPWHIVGRRRLLSVEIFHISGSIGVPYIFEQYREMGFAVTTAEFPSCLLDACRISTTEHIYRGLEERGIHTSSGFILGDPATSELCFVYASKQETDSVRQEHERTDRLPVRAGRCTVLGTIDDFIVNFMAAEADLAPYYNIDGSLNGMGVAVSRDSGLSERKNIELRAHINHILGKTRKRSDASKKKQLARKAQKKAEKKETDAQTGGDADDHVLAPGSHRLLHLEYIPDEDFIQLVTDGTTVRFIRAHSRKRRRSE